MKFCRPTFNQRDGMTFLMFGVIQKLYLRLEEILFDNPTQMPQIGANVLDSKRKQEKIIASKLTDGVMVAQRFLAPFVGVRVPIGQPL